MERILVKETINKTEEVVKLQGWAANLRLMGKMTFLDLRDRTGKVQCLYYGKMKDITLESVIEIRGTVKQRPEHQITKDFETGAIEIEVQEYKLLNKCNPLPIPVMGDGLDIREEARLEYRYLDIRRERMSKIINLRSDFVHALRKQLHQKSFIEVETPLLTASTMEGARDFVVPSRIYPGKFYALPQSPQQYKQLLMTAGLEKYFQFARCVRDEDLRADRGFEFTQLDLELSFVEKEADVMDIVEDMVKESVKKVGRTLKDAKFPVIDYKEAMQKYGEDKFDLRSQNEKEKGILAFAWVINFPFFKKTAEADEAEKKDSKSDWTFTHNPFSMPHKAYLQDHLEGRNIEKILTAQYDLVCNGYEVGGGSIRAHKSEILRATYRIMGYSDSEIEQSIGHMLKAFDLGTPPHGGIALGLDRLIMLLAGETSLKETIAFPMTYKGRTAVMQGPGNISKGQIKELGLIVKTTDISDGRKMVEAIKALLEAKGKTFEHMVHEETPTSEDSARIRGTSMEEGVKALLFRGKKSGENYMFNLPGHLKINIKEVEKMVGEKVEMEKPDIIKERYGLFVGGVPPFGNLLNVPNYFDKNVLDEERAVFNSGLRTESIIMKSKDLVEIAEGILGDFSK